MGEPQPKVLIFSGEGVPAEDLERRLRDAYAVTMLPPGIVPGSAQNADPHLVVAWSEDLSRAGIGPAGIVSSALLAAVSQGVCLIAPDGAVVWADERFGSHDERTRSDIAAVCRQAAAWFLDKAARGKGPGGGVRRFELNQPEQGRSYEVLVSPVAVQAAGVGGVTLPAGAVAVLIRDISADRRLRQKLDAIDRAGGELVRFDAGAVREMNVVERLKLLESRIVKWCRDLLRSQHFAIRLIDERTGKLEVVIAAGLPQEALELDLYPSIEGNGISGYVAATGRSYICHDAESDSQFLPGIAGARSSLTVPLRLHDKVIGVFDIESADEGAFNEEDRQFAEIFARYLAMALNMLDLLVVERSATNETVSDRVENELREPLQDILVEAERLTDAAVRDPEMALHVERIRADVEAIRARVKNVCSGPQTLLGVERAMAERRREPLLEGKRVLVADDESNIRRIIHDVLQNRGCEVETFENGALAIKALEEVVRGGRAPYDAVVSDIKMPDRNGYEVFAMARRCCPGVPVILMTGFGYDPHHSIVRASQDGLQSVLFKPFQVERLLDEVRRAVGAVRDGAA